MIQSPFYVSLNTHTHTHVYVKYIVTKKNIRLNFVIFITIELYCPALLAV